MLARIFAGGPLPAHCRAASGPCHPADTVSASIFQEFPAMSNSIKHVTDATFESDVLKSDLPVLVDYWAEWCGPCKMIAPLLDEAANQYQGRVIIAKLNVDDNPDTAARFGIRGIPTLMLFKDGKAVATKVGAMSKSQLNAFLDESL
jgi:thioredoxin 1